MVGQNMKIGIVNQGLGNIGSVYSAFEFYKYNVSLIHNPDELEKVDTIVMAGVGNFATTVLKLKELNLWDKLNEEVLVKEKPILGICLGMQLFADWSYEDGENEGFGWIKGSVVKIKGESIRIPHIGWDEVKPMEKKLFRGARDNFFYFMHSYHFIPENEAVVIATVNYSGLEIVSAVRKDNIVGVQFHPEKSQGDGLRFLKNFVGAMV